MKRILIIGAAGRAGAQVVHFLKGEDIDLTLVSRSINSSHYPDVKAKRIAFDATDLEKLTKAVENQDIIVVVSNGDALAQARALLQALKDSHTKPERIIWLTGMGIHGEVPGLQGLHYRLLAKTMKSYIEAADTIAASPHPSVLLRAPLIVEEDDATYQLLPEGVKLPSQKIAYAGIGHCIADMVGGEIHLDGKESLGIVQ